jgi:hypothetical protein
VPGMVASPRAGAAQGSPAGRARSCYGWPMARKVNWSRRFPHPITPIDGERLVTLRDVVDYMHLIGAAVGITGRRGSTWPISCSTRPSATGPLWPCGSTRPVPTTRVRHGSPIGPTSTLTTPPAWSPSSARPRPQSRALVTEASGPILSLLRRDDDEDERVKPRENGRKCKADWCELCQFDEHGKRLRRFGRERDRSLSHRRLYSGCYWPVMGRSICRVADIGESNPRRAGLRLKPAVAPGHPCDQGNRAKRRRKKHRHEHPIRPRQFTHDGIMCRLPRTGGRSDSSGRNA